MTSPDRRSRFDPVRFALHFLAGAVFGASFGFLLGAILGVDLDEDMLWCVGICSLVTGLAGGLWGDTFWQRLSAFLRYISQWWWFPG